MKDSVTPKSSQNQLAQRCACIVCTLALQSCCVIEPLPHRSPAASFNAVLISLRCGLQPFKNLMHGVRLVTKGAVSAVKTAHKVAAPMLNTARNMAKPVIATAKQSIKVAKKVSKAAVEQKHKLDNGFKEMKRYAACYHCTHILHGVLHEVLYTDWRASMHLCSLTFAASTLGDKQRSRKRTTLRILILTSVVKIDVTS
jgi:hypothetical protein